MAEASGNTTGLGGQPSVTVKQYTSAAANIASREVARNNYKYRSMNDAKLQQLRQVLYRRVQTWPQGDKINILVEYGFQTNGVSPSDIDALVVEALIIYMSEAELDSLLKDMMMDEQRIQRKVKTIESKTKNSRKKFKNQFNNLSFNDAYLEFRDSKKKKKKDPGKNIKKFLKGYDKSFKVNKSFVSSFKQLQTEIIRMLKEMYEPSDLYGIATEMGIEVDEKMAAAQVIRMIAEKTLLYVAMVTGKTKGVAIHGAIDDVEPYNDVLKYTSFAWVTGNPGLSLNQLAKIKQQARNAKAEMKGQMNVRQKAKKGKGKGYKKALQSVTGQKGKLTKRSMKHNNDVGVLAGMSDDELIQTANKYGIEIKDPSKIDAAELRIQIYQKMASAQRIYNRLNKQAAKAEAKGQHEKAAQLKAQATATKKAMRLTRSGMNATETLQGTPIVRLGNDGKVMNKILMAVPVIIAGQADPKALNSDDGEIDLMDRAIDPDQAVKKKRKRADRVASVLQKNPTLYDPNNTGSSRQLGKINKILGKAGKKFGQTYGQFEYYVAESDDGVTPKMGTDGKPILKMVNGKPVVADENTPESLKIEAGVAGTEQLAGMSHRQLRKFNKANTKLTKQAMKLAAKGDNAAFEKKFGMSIKDWQAQAGDDPLNKGTTQAMITKDMKDKENEEQIQKLHVTLEKEVYHNKDGLSGLNVWVLNWPDKKATVAASASTGTGSSAASSLLSDLSEKPNPDRQLADYVKTGSKEEEYKGKTEKLSNAFRMELKYCKENNLQEGTDYKVRGTGDKRHCYFLNPTTGEYTIYYTKKELRDMMYVDKDGNASATKAEKFLGNFNRGLKRADMAKSNIHHTKGAEGFKSIADANKDRLDKFEKNDSTESYVDLSSDLISSDSNSLGFRYVRARKFSGNDRKNVTPWVQPVFLVNKEVPVDVTAFSCISDILSGLASSLISALTGGLFAKGGTGSAGGNKKSSFISGDSLNGKPNEERVDIDWQRKQYKVTPIPKLAKGGTGSSLSDKTTSLNGSTSSAPLSVSLSDNLISYSNKLSGDDGSGKALKVYMVNNPLTEELTVNGSSGTLAEMLNIIASQLSNISQLITTTNEYSSAIATGTAAVGTAVNKLASSSASSGGSAFESGFTNALDGILQGG